MTSMRTELLVLKLSLLDSRERVIGEESGSVVRIGLVGCKSSGSGDCGVGKEPRLLRTRKRQTPVALSDQNILGTIVDSFFCLAISSGLGLPHPRIFLDTELRRVQSLIMRSAHSTKPQKL